MADESGQCPECGHTQTIAEMTIKMGGLLCNKCRTIIVWPHDPVFRKEMYRRRGETDETKDDKTSEA